jgi:hypothetical protein
MESNADERLSIEGFHSSNTDIENLRNDVVRDSRVDSDLQSQNLRAGKLLEMVLYHANGRVVKVHEDYLEREAARHATTPNIQYEDQIEVCKKHTPEAREQESRAYLIIVDQTWHTLYAKNFGTLWEEITDLKRRDNSDSMPEQGVDRATLMKCSTFADEYFRYHPDEVELHLPV